MGITTQNINFLDARPNYQENRFINKTENRVHNHNFDLIYESLIPAAIKQNHEYEGITGIKLNNFNELYDSKEIEFNNNRSMKIRWLKIPTFPKENREKYYVMFLVNIDWYTREDFHDIWGTCLNTINRENIDDWQRGFTIFLSGKQVGRMLPTAGRQYNIWKLNTITKKQEKRQPTEVRAKIFKILMRFFEKRLEKIKEKTNQGFNYYRGEKRKHNLFGKLLQHYDRLNNFNNRLWKTFHHWIKQYYRILSDKIKHMTPEERISNNIRKQSSQYLNLCKAVGIDVSNYKKLTNRDYGD